MANANANQSKKSFYNPFENMSSMPNMMDFGKMRQQYSKSIEAWTEANQVILDFAKESTRRAAEVMQRNAQCIYDCSKDAMACKNLEEAQSKQANMIASVMENTFAQAKESTDISSKAAKEILDMCNKRLSEALSEACNS